MEKSQNIVAVPYNDGWSDLGNWESIWQASDRDSLDMAVSGNATAINYANSLIRSEDKNIHIVGLGLENMIAVAMRDAVLIADKNKAQDVKNIVTLLKENNYHRLKFSLKTIGHGVV